MFGFGFGLYTPFGNVNDKSIQVRDVNSNISILSLVDHGNPLRINQNSSTNHGIMRYINIHPLAFLVSSQE